MSEGESRRWRDASAGVAALALLVACACAGAQQAPPQAHAQAKGAEDPPGQHQEEPQNERQREAQQRKARDFAVLEAVPRDAATRDYGPEDPNQPTFSLAAAGDAPRVIFFDPKPLDGGRAVPPAERARAPARAAVRALEPLHFRKVWERMPPGERIAAREAAADAASRRDAGAGALRGLGPGGRASASTSASDGPFAGYRPRHGHVRLVTAKPAAAAGEDRRTAARRSFPVLASVPGYARGGTYALVRLGFSDLFHASHGTYLLKRRPGGDWVVVRRAFVTYA